MDNIQNILKEIETDFEKYCNEKKYNVKLDLTPSKSQKNIYDVSVVIIFKPNESIHDEVFTALNEILDRYNTHMYYALPHGASSLESNFIIRI